MTKSHAATLIAERLGTDLTAYVAAQRANGDSWQTIALALYRQTDVLVTDETLRRWFRNQAA